MKDIAVVSATIHDQLAGDLKAECVNMEAIHTSLYTIKCRDGLIKVRVEEKEKRRP